MKDFFEAINTFLWGAPLILGIMGTGLILTLVLGGLQFRKLGFALRNTLLKVFDKSHKDHDGDISPFAALSTALAATVGTGNIVGVSLAIILGGPGAIFWMWVAAIFGMATKFSEVSLALAFRENKNGRFVGGPMYYIKNGLGKNGLAKTFALFAGIAVFGIGNSTQSNAIAGVLKSNYNINPLITGLVLATLVGFVIVGGISSISKVTSKLVPLMSLLYILGSIYLLFLNRAYIIPAFKSIFLGAFSPASLGGSFVGLTFKQVISSGVARGVFTNEAGLGSSPIAHASASTDHPCRQGLWGMSEVFVDTIIICTMTALVILTSQISWTSSSDASSLVANAFAESTNYGSYVVSIGLTLFALSTIMGWAYYGETALTYLFGDKIVIPYRILYIIFVFVGANVDLGLVWIIANILNALMALPNLYALIMLSPVVKRLADDFFKDPTRIRKSPDEYKDLLNRK